MNAGTLVVIKFYQEYTHDSIMCTELSSLHMLFSKCQCIIFEGLVYELHILSGASYNASLGNAFIHYFEITRNTYKADI